MRRFGTATCLGVMCSTGAAWAVEPVLTPDMVPQNLHRLLPRHQLQQPHGPAISPASPSEDRLPEARGRVPEGAPKIIASGFGGDPSRPILGGDPVELDVRSVWVDPGTHNFGPEASVRPFGMTSPIGYGAGPWGAALTEGRQRSSLYAMSVTRGWPGAIGLYGEQLGFDVSPHAGVGISSYGRTTEAGATLRFGEGLSEDLRQQGLKTLGIRDGKSFGQRARWYVYAAASGQSVGYNFIQGDQNLRPSNGFSTDSGAFIGDHSAGIAWRKGDVQASFGYVHREIKSRNWHDEENFVAFQISIKPTLGR